MAENVISEGVIQVRLDDDVDQGLKRIERNYERGLKQLEKKKAVIDINANLKDLKRDLAAANKEISAWERKREQAGGKLNRSDAARLGAQRKLARVLREQVKEQTDQVDTIRQQIKETQNLIQKDNLLLRTQQQRTAHMEKQAKLQERAARATSQQEAEVVRLQKSYIKLQEQVANFERQRSKLANRLSPDARQRIEIDSDLAMRQMVQTRKRLQALGEDPIEIDVDIRGDTSFFGRLARSLTEMTVRVGPFTATIKQFAVALGLLGPIIIDLLGIVGALTGAIGAGLAGALGVGSAALSGFVLAASGIFFIMKPLVAEFSAAKKASEAYNKAVDEHGENSKEAARAQEKMNNVLGAISPTAKEGFQSLGALGKRFTKLTQTKARPVFLETLGQGIKTVSALMPDFARNSVNAFTAVGQGMQNWLKGLRGNEARGLIDKIFGNFNDSIPNILSGLGSLGAAFGRIAAAFSTYLPMLTRGFADWADGIADATGNAGQMENRAGNLVSAFQRLGQFIKAGTRVIYEFFRASTGTGAARLDSLTDGMNRLADSMGSVAGQRSLRNFFEEAADTTHRLWGVMRPLLELFVEFATILRPMAQGLLSIVGPLAELTSTVLGWGPMKVLIQGVAAALLFKGVGGRIASVVGDITKLRAAMAGLTALEAGSMLLGGKRGKAAKGGFGFSQALGGAGGAAAMTGLSATMLAVAAAATVVGGAIYFAGQKDRQTGKIIERGAKSWKEYYAAVKSGNLDDFSVRSQAAQQASKQNVKGLEAELTKLKQLRKTPTGLTMYAELSEEIRQKEQQINEARAKGAAELRNINAEQRRAAAGAADMERAMQGWLPMTKRAAGAIANLNKRIGEGATSQLITNKYKDPGTAGRVASAASQAATKGVKATTVVRILADSRSAEEAIRRLNAAKLNAKIVNIGVKGGGEVLDTLEAVDRKRIKEKLTQIIERGGKPTLNTIERLIRATIPNKQFSVTSKAGQALTEIALLKAGLDKLQSKAITVSVTKIERSFGTRSGIQGRATGGKVSPRQARAGKGGQFDKPTYLVGEENKDEFVIATNPAYRKNNLRYLAQAASSLGTSVMDPKLAARMAKQMGGAEFERMTGIMPRAEGGGKKKKWSAAKIKRDRSEAKKLHPKKHKKARRTSGPAMRRVEELQLAQSNQEREVGIRENQLQEPEDFIKPTGELIPGTDEPVMTVDQDAIRDFQAQLSHVIEAYNTLIDIIDDLTGKNGAIAAAVNEVSSEINARKGNVNIFDSAMIRAKRMMNNEGMAPQARAIARRRYNIYKGQKTAEQAALNRAYDDRKDLKTDETDANFDLREATFARDQHATQRNAILGDASAIVSETNIANEKMGQEKLESDRKAAAEKAESDKRDAAEGGGSGSSIPSLATQSISLSNARSELMSQFGGNQRGGGIAGGLRGGRAAGGAFGPSLGQTLAGGAGGFAAVGGVGRASGVARGGSVSGSSMGGIAGGGGNTIVQNITMMTPPPEPHAWSQGVGFELKALG